MTTGTVLWYRNKQMGWLLKIISPYFSHGGYYILFLMTFLETALFFGFIVPGESIVVISGLLAAKGVLDLGNVFLVAALGAVLGDQMGYLIGREFGKKLISKYGGRFFLKKAYLSETERFFEKHGGKTVFLGRFAAWLRAMSPFVAGTSRMSYLKFLFFNAAGGLVWALGYSLVGYLVGDSWERIRHYIGVAGILSVIVLAGLFFIWRLIHREKRLLIERLGWMDKTLSAQVPLTWGFLKARLDVERWWGLRLTLALSAIFMAFHTFGEIIENQTRKGFLYRLDAKASAFIGGIASPGFAKVMTLASAILDFYTMAAAALALAVFLIFKRNWWRLYAFVLAVGAGEPLLYLLKIGIRGRPGFPVTFPSGYAFTSMVLFGFWAYIIWRAHAAEKREKGRVGKGREAFRAAAFSLAVLLALLVGASRIYWDAHWLTDVLGGYAAGFAWLAISVVIVRSIEESVKTKKTENNPKKGWPDSGAVI